jgi:predicted pyridoxine 5'-phosphate oxidase superfamily flavin-nucleotide-binding protein
MDARSHEGNRELQERFDTRRLADRIENLLMHETFTDREKAFVESRDMFFLATADDHGRPNVFKLIVNDAPKPSVASE